MFLTPTGTVKMQGNEECPQVALPLLENTQGVSTETQNQFFGLRCWSPLHKICWCVCVCIHTCVYSYMGTHTHVIMCAWIFMHRSVVLSQGLTQSQTELISSDDAGVPWKLSCQRQKELSSPISQIKHLTERRDLEIIISYSIRCAQQNCPPNTMIVQRIIHQ